VPAVLRALPRSGAKQGLIPWLSLWILDIQCHQNRHTIITGMPAASFTLWQYLQRLLNRKQSRLPCLHKP